MVFKNLGFFSCVGCVFAKVKIFAQLGHPEHSKTANNFYLLHHLSPQPFEHFCDY